MLSGCYDMEIVETPDVESFRAAVKPVYEAYPQFADYIAPSRLPWPSKAGSHDTINGAPLKSAVFYRRNLS